MPAACVLQHIWCEPPGIFAGLLRARGIGIETVELDEGGELPDWRDVDLVLAMGGPMGAYQEQEYPWLQAEKRWIADAVRAGVPFLGVCLGSQLLAASLGGQVYPGKSPEVGVLPVWLTPAGREDPVTGGLADEFLALQWHGDTFGVPPGADLLASSAGYPHQVFRFGRAAYGVQFHLEVTGQMLAQWQQVPAYRASAAAALGPGGCAELTGPFGAAKEAMTESATRLLTGWLSLALAGPVR